MFSNLSWAWYLSKPDKHNSQFVEGQLNLGAKFSHDFEGPKHSYFRKISFSGEVNTEGLTSTLAFEFGERSSNTHQQIGTDMSAIISWTRKWDRSYKLECGLSFTTGKIQIV